MSCIRKSFVKQGLPDSTVNITMSSWRSNTKATYNVYIKQWVEYRTNENIDDINASVKDGLKILTHIFENNRRYSTVSGA